MEDRHFADLIAQHFSGVIDEWQLSTKVTTIGTDNAFNMINAVKKMPYQSLPCVAHAFQLSVKKGMDEAGASRISYTGCSDTLEFNVHHD